MKNLLVGLLVLLAGLFVWSCTQTDVAEELPTPTEPESFEVTIDEAKEKLNDLLGAMGPQTRSEARTIDEDNEIKYVYGKQGMHKFSADGEEQPLFYVIEMADEQGYAFVSTDERTTPIYAVIDEGSYEENTDNPGLQLFMVWAEDAYYQEIEEANNAKTSEKTLAPTQTRATTLAGPLLTTKWGQFAPYNKNCPYIGNSQCLAGCIPIAVAQVAAYHRFPSYKALGRWDTYDWNAMLASATIPDNGSRAATDVAFLVHYIGMSTEVTYGVTATGGAPSNVLNWFRNSAIYSSPGTMGWFSSVATIASLRQNCPVIAGGLDPRVDVGHCWVIDGYSETLSGDPNGWIAVDRYFHNNWGWDGDANGWFAERAFNPYLSGQSLNFGTEARVYTGIHN